MPDRSYYIDSTPEMARYCRFFLALKWTEWYRRPFLFALGMMDWHRRPSKAN